MWDCPKRGNLNTLETEQKTKGSDCEWVITLHLLNALQGKSLKGKRLIIMKTLINGNETRAMVDW